MLPMVENSSKPTRSTSLDIAAMAKVKMKMQAITAPRQRKTCPTARAHSTLYSDILMETVARSRTSKENKKTPKLERTS